MLHFGVYWLIFLYTVTIHTDTSVSSCNVQTFLCYIVVCTVISLSQHNKCRYFCHIMVCMVFLCHKFSQKPAFEMRHCFYSSNWRMWRGASYQTPWDPAQCTFFAADWFIPGRYDICSTVPNASFITSQEPVNACPINCICAIPSAPPTITQQQWVFFCISLESSAHFKLLPLTGANCCP